VVARYTSLQVIVSLMNVSDSGVKWTYELDFNYYDDAPMLIDYIDLKDEGHHSLATKNSGGGFNIARLKIGNANSELKDTK
jgi:hypothetical protein